ncbi:MAG: rhodanese-related sulfurtransferase [Candidatus Babeliales bacterium]
MGKILIYYKYTDIEDPHAIMQWQQTLCKELGITGRILLAKEGINGTVGGTDEATESYKKAMAEHPLFADMPIKSSEGGAHHFPKLRVAVRNEIVTLGLSPDEIKATGERTHLSPEQVHELLNNKPEDLVILDARNTYESAIGAFKDAVIPDIENFRDFPQYIKDNLDKFKDKQVLMYCTSGVRCERATAVLERENVAKSVHQITGGVQCYADKFPEGHFRGKNYVFDGRIAMKVNEDVLGSCYICAKPWDDYTNCLNVLCNRQHLSCPTCIAKLENTCSKECQELVKNGLVEIRVSRARTELKHDT